MKTTLAPLTLVFLLSPPSPNPLSSFSFSLPLSTFLASANTSAEAEKRSYTAADVPGGPRFIDYHKLLDHYYEHGMTEEELVESIRETMAYRLSLPQVYYKGAGYIPGVDEGRRPGE